MLEKNNSDSEYYGRDLVMWCNVSNMLAKINSDSEYYERDLVTWCNVCNMSAKNNSDSEYYGRDFVTQIKNNITFVTLFLLIQNNFSNRPK